MKKFLPVLLGLLCAPAFAEVAPVGYWDEVANNESPFIDEQEAQDTAPVVAPKVSVAPMVSTARATVARTAARAVPTTTAGITGTRASAPSRAVASRNASASIRSFGNTNTSRALTSRQAANVPAASTARAATSSLVQTNTVSQPLYNRVGVRGTTATGIGSVAAARVGSVSVGTSVSAADAGASMEELAQLTDFCKAQYNSCMDNFCNVLDDNQGRCSCSANLNNYKKTEDALKQATEDLQRVAMNIQYLGLSRDQVTSLFSQTEAEAAMSGTTDTTQLKNDLDKIGKLLFDVKGGNSVSGGADGLLLDFGNMDFTIDTGFDLSALLGTGTGNVSNQRGAELYKTASARCKASVLDTCKRQGVDTTLISNGYDLEIDKQCIAYERALDDSNTQMRRTLLNAQGFLERARLTVAQNRNIYTTTRECVSALDSCMQDDFVCGSDYQQCLDPTGKYIVNGEVVASANSGDISSGLGAAWGGAWTGSGGLNAFINSNQGGFNNENMVGFLETKIGRNDNGLDTGMCMGVLNQCQNYTYTGSNGRYNPKNEVVREYLGRALVQIKASQDSLVADYVENCKADVQSCLISNGAVIGDGGQNIGYATNAMYNACKSSLETCGNAGNSTGEDLFFDIVCYNPTAGAVSNGNGWAVASASGLSCACPSLPAGYTGIGVAPSWNLGTKLCSCPAGTNWDYERGACFCSDTTKVYNTATRQCSCPTGTSANPTTGVCE
jgi:hypothetical protein